MRAELVGSSPRLRAPLRAFCYCAIWRRAEGCLRENREAGAELCALDVVEARAPRLVALAARSQTPQSARRQPLEPAAPPAAHGSGSVANGSSAPPPSECW